MIKRAGLLSMSLGALEGVGVKSRATVSRPSMQELLILLWKLFDINRVSRLLSQSSQLTVLQKFRAHVVEGDRAMDVMALILCYSLELKDKPSECVHSLQSPWLIDLRVKWYLSCIELYAAIIVCRT